MWIVSTSLSSGRPSSISENHLPYVFGLPLVGDEDFLGGQRWSPHRIAEGDRHLRNVDELREVGRPVGHRHEPITPRQRAREIT